MIPNITIGSRTISAYMICTIIGVLVSGAIALKKANKRDSIELTTVLLWSAPGVIIGGHLLYAITNLSSIVLAIQNGKGLLAVLSYFGGNVFYGGLIGGIISSVIYCKLANIDYTKHINTAALFIPLFHFFGRIGCFLTGCCYGVECKVGFIYKYSLITSANNVTRFPIQLVEALGNFIIFLIVLKLFSDIRFYGKLFSVYCILYSILRFMTEFFRGDEYRGFLFSLSTSQIISMFILAFGVITYVNKKHKVYPLKTEC